MQVTFEKSVWTLPAAEIAQFVDQSVATNDLAGPRSPSAESATSWPPGWRSASATRIQRDPVDAEVGWNGEKLVSVEESVDGVTLDAPKLAGAVEQAFFGSGGSVTAAPLLPAVLR